MRRYWVAPCVFGAYGQAAFLRASSVASVDLAPGGDAEKVEQLLLDIDESIKKAGSDAEFVYTSMYNYDSQLEAGLDKEIAKVRQEMLKLRNTTHPKQVNSRVAVVEASTAEGRSDAAQQQLEKVFETVRILTEFMSRGSMPKVQLDAAEQHLGPNVVLTESLRSLRHLLSAHQEFRPHFVDVFEAFVPAGPISLVQAQTKRKSNTKRASLKVHLTPKLRQDTVAALAAIKSKLANTSEHHVAFLQTRAASTLKVANEGMVAEKEEAMQELEFSSKFAEAVANIDSELKAKVHESILKKANIVEGIRRSRDAQHRALGALVDLLRGKYLVGDAADAEDGVNTGDGGRLSFLQASAFKPSTLQLQIESALHNKADTHSILMKVQGMLDRSTPIEAEGVASVVSDCQNLLREVQTEQSKADEMRNICKNQTVHGSNEEHQMSANLALMSAARDRAKVAIGQAKSHLKSAVAKMQTLKHETQALGAVVAKTTHTLDDQSKDRHTIMAAVEKAREIVLDRTSSGPEADSFFTQILQELQAQESHDREYRGVEGNFRTSFAAYAQEYSQLLEERRGHYETLLSSLELYAGEVESDAATQADAIKSNQALANEGGAVCEGIMQAYVADSDRRRALGNMLTSVAPELPKVLS